MPQESLATTTNAHISRRHDRWEREIPSQRKLPKPGPISNIFLRLEVFSVCSFNVQKTQQSSRSHNNIRCSLFTHSLLFLRVFSRLSTAALYLFLFADARFIHNISVDKISILFFAVLTFHHSKAALAGVSPLKTQKAAQRDPSRPSSVSVGYQRIFHLYASNYKSVLLLLRKFRKLLKAKHLLGDGYWRRVYTRGGGFVRGFVTLSSVQAAR